ncbi:hypothetical protein C814_01652 [Anaerotruncus sp. G3(2012)]|uniref:sodium/glutamate symporter n=1 Tax=Anaerotruncus sp. G3(2012) TaxID=1235835 RepID=UPI00033D073D|nr:sodium/glutamate symporter [Anaerotruncus sp. G3(2012)]EOS61283.1 hypothetical protein C814_01652 [Anaerotruncus sp. G3(2012)]
MDYTHMSFLYDFAFMSLLLIIAQFLRSNIKFLQMFYIPASVLAGIFGLLLGPQFLNIIPWSGRIGSYAYMLVCVLFGGLFLGKKSGAGAKKTFKQVGDSFCVNMGAEFFCFGIAMLIGGALVMLLFPEVFIEISLLMPSGYLGGHGYASTIGTALNNLLGREDGVVIGQTFATIGLLTGLFGGIACINYATRKGATRLVDKAESLPEDCRTGIVPPGKRASMGEETINPMSMDPLAWHLALTLIATLAGYLFYDWYKQYLPSIELPVMCLTMIFGVIIQTILNHTPFRDSVDEHVEGRIGSMVTDYLVGFGVASISITVVMEFAAPILLLCLLGTLTSLVLVFVVGRKLFHNFWFERSIFVFGWTTGVVAIGVTLLRIVDPEAKSGTLSDYGYAYTLQSVVEVFIIALTPILAVSMGCIATGLIETAIALALFLVSAVLFGIRKEKMNELRPGEAEVLKQ